jgi:RND superfamily putative drug exporter
MFRLLGETVTRTWALLLAGWVVLLAASRLAAPVWEEVVQDREFAFLPADAPSRRAEEVFTKAFPDDQLASNVVVVLRRTDDATGHLDRAKRFIEDVLEPGLRQIAEDEGGLAGEVPPPEEPLFPGEAGGTRPGRQPSLIARIRTPNAPGTGALLVSEDGRALLVVVELTTDFLSRRNWPTLAKIEDLIDSLRRAGKVPPGLDLTLTGSAVTGRDYTRAQLQSARATELWTVLLVVALLILIYRAPLLALIPLATVFLAVQIGLALLALLARAGYVTLFEGIQIYLTVLTYGAGVDYCLFLTARYKEELDGGAHPREAVAHALGHVGTALTASAATVICGIGMMGFAEFGKFRQAGIAIPLGLLVVLAATLTFSPALLRLAGRWAFWPQRPRQEGKNKGEPLPPKGPGQESRPGGGLHPGWEKLGQVLVRWPGTIWLASVALLAPFAVAAVLLSHHVTYDLIGNLPADAPSVTGTRALQEHFPAGLLGPVTVVLVNPDVDFASAKGRALVEQLTERLREQKAELGLADLRSLTAPLGVTPAAGRAYAGLDVPEETLREAIQREAREYYASDFGERRKIGTRLELVLEQNPFDRPTIDNLDRVEHACRDALPAELRKGTELYLAGPTASVRDLRAVRDRDRVRIEVLVLVSVFVILLLLLRRLVVSLYLILSVLFSYYATLGVAFAVFGLLDPQGFAGLDWKVTLFLFTILIAVGEDYNIFLMTRIAEEQRRYGPVRGLTEALARTGPIISSCGIIMAGTFASLLAGSLTEMKQLGFALAFGVLLDTFVVRPILVPAFLLLLQGSRFRGLHV